MNGHLFAEGPAELGGVASNYITHGRYLSFNPTIFTITETNYSIRLSPLCLSCQEKKMLPQTLLRR